MRWTRRFSGAALGTCLALGVGGCAATQEVAESASYVFLPPEQEEQLGEQMAAEFEREVRLLDDPQIQQYVSELGRQVVAQAEVPQGIDFEFKVIDDPKTVNAVALPGGNIYVYSGLLREAESEAELVAVLAHEVAHVAERHIASQLVTTFGLQLVTQMALGQQVTQLEALVANIGTQGAMLGFSRTAEREADDFGLRYVTAAGWDPHGYVSFFSKLAEEDVDVPIFLRSHPPPEDRVANAQQFIAQLPRVPQRTGEQRYQRMMDQLERTEVAERQAASR